MVGIKETQAPTRISPWLQTQGYQPSPQTSASPRRELSIEEVKNLAGSAADLADMSPRVAIAQLVAENRDLSKLKGKYNYYNLGAYDKDVYNAFNYDTPEAGIKAYIELLRTDPRYKEAWKVRRNPEAMIREIERAGYASRKNYSDFVMSTPEWREND